MPGEATKSFVWWDLVGLHWIKLYFRYALAQSRNNADLMNFGGIGWTPLQESYTLRSPSTRTDSSRNNLDLKYVILFARLQKDNLARSTHEPEHPTAAVPTYAPALLRCLFPNTQDPRLPWHWSTPCWNDGPSDLAGRVGAGC